MSRSVSILQVLAAMCCLTCFIALHPLVAEEDGAETKPLTVQGTVASIDEDTLTVTPTVADGEDPLDDLILDVDEDTKIKVPKKKNATLDDIVEGNRVTVTYVEEDDATRALQIKVEKDKKDKKKDKKPAADEDMDDGEDMDDDEDMEESWME